MELESDWWAEGEATEENTTLPGPGVVFRTDSAAASALTTLRDDLDRVRKSFVSFRF